MAELQTSLGAAAESHREDAADQRCGRAADRLGRSGKEAGRGTAMAKRQAGNAAVAKRLLAEAPWQSRRRQRGIPVARERHGRLARECQQQTGTGTPATQKSQLRQTELALLKPLVVSKRNNL